MFFTECTLPQMDKNPGQKIAWLFLVLIIIVFFICPGSGAMDMPGTKNDIFTLSMAESPGSTPDLKVPGYFYPVLSKDHRMDFFYSTQSSDTVLMTGGDLMILPRSPAGSGTQENTIYLKFRGQDSRIMPRGEEPYPGRANFFMGNNSSEWRTGIPTYRSVLYPDMYPGISLVYSDQGGQLKSEFLIAPAADPENISYGYEGGTAIWIDESGALVVQMENGGQLIEAKPDAYQVIGDDKTVIPVSFHLSDDYHLGFTPGEYNAQYPLIIDPKIITSRYLGGDVEDVGTGITVDKKGDIYVVGYTHSKDFPVTGNAFDETSRGFHDIFVTAYSKDGRDVLFSTFLGGAANDYARAVVVDDNGTIFITGSTESPDFPVKSAFQPEIGGKYDAFITALRPGGTDLAFSSYLGGSDVDDAFGMALPGDNNRMYLTGTTQSPDFPTLNAYQEAKAGQYDAFLTVIDTGRKNLTASTFLGGRQDDYGRAVATDNSGNVYIGGYTYSSKSSDFPIKNALFSAHTMTYDAFVSKFNPDAEDLIYSTYIGGSMGDRISAIAVDQKNQLVATGYTFADDFPVSADAFQREYGGNLLADAFVIGLAPDGQSLAGSTYLGGSKDDMGYGITIGDDGTIFVTGGTMSENFPVACSWQQRLKGPMNAFVTGLDPSYARLTFSSYLGGEGSDRSAAIIHDTHNLLYVTGTTGSDQFPVLNPIGGTYKGDDDAFLAIISPDATSCGNRVMNFRGIPSFKMAPGAWEFGKGQCRISEKREVQYCLPFTVR
jgi:hypothetical protein